MLEQIILASKSKVRKKILDENYISCIVEPSNIDEDSVKESLLKENAKVIGFPIHEYWIDVGQKNDLQKADKDFEENFF